MTAHLGLYTHSCTLLLLCFEFMIGDSPFEAVSDDTKLPAGGHRIRILAVVALEI